MPDSKPTRADIAAAALSLVGRPYQAQGRASESVPGLDCGGVLIVIGQQTGISAFEFLGYSAEPDGVTFGRLLDEHLDRLPEVHEARLADVLAVDFGQGIQHTMMVVAVHETRRDSHHYAVVHATRKHGVNRGPIPMLYYKSLARAYSIGRYTSD
jgi:hypothetical protein